MTAAIFLAHDGKGNAAVYPVTLVTWYQVAPSAGWVALTDTRIEGWAVYRCEAGRREYAAFFPDKESACGWADFCARMARKQITREQDGETTEIE